MYMVHAFSGIRPKKPIAKKIENNINNNKKTRTANMTGNREFDVQ